MVGLKIEESIWVNNTPKIPLRLRDILLRAPDKIDLHSSTESGWTCTRLIDGLQRDYFYVGITRERFSIPLNVIGLIHTDSRIARCGLDVLKSSWYVAPGFGLDKPLPLVLEIDARVNLVGIDDNIVVAGLILLESDEYFQNSLNEHATRFPLPQLLKGIEL